MVLKKEQIRQGLPRLDLSAQHLDPKEKHQRQTVSRSARDHHVTSLRQQRLHLSLPRYT
jgi:hypothetical protein